MSNSSNQLQLQSEKIIETIDKLYHRISERFPNAGLSRVAQRLNTVAQSAVQETQRFNRPNLPLRIMIAVLMALMAVVVVLFISQLRFKEDASGWTALEGFDAGISSTVFLGAAVVFLISLESRVKRRRTLMAIEQLRELAHIVDMHQLTKDPERLCRTHQPTASSPTQAMTPFELGRYLDYCSEMLALIGKVVMIYGQNTSDSVVLDAIDAIETLTTGLCRKIWQKIMLLDQFFPREDRDAAKTGAAIPGAAEVDTGSQPESNGD